MNCDLYINDNKPATDKGWLADPGGRGHVEGHIALCSDCGTKGEDPRQLKTLKGGTRTFGTFMSFTVTP